MYLFAKQRSPLIGCVGSIPAASATFKLGRTLVGIQSSEMQRLGNKLDDTNTAHHFQMARSFNGQDCSLLRRQQRFDSSTGYHFNWGEA